MNPNELLDYLLTNAESEFVEFKTNSTNPESIGQLISALANGAVLSKKEDSYLVFGVDDTGQIEGTNFNPETAKKGNEPLKSWLSHNLKHCNPLEYLPAKRSGRDIWIVVIPRANMYPVKFAGVEYIRVGEVKKKLSEHPELARKLWEEILRVSFEDGNASDLLDEEEIFDLLDFTSYFAHKGIPVPTKRINTIGHMLNEGILIKKFGKYFITNLGALLFAKDLSNFESLINRGVRLIKYKGTDKTVVERSFEGQKGYALGINDLIEFIMLLLPNEEYLEKGVRRNRQIFPLEAIKELVTNMLIHQDFAVTGYAPRVEIYSDRVEFSNPGAPLIEISRFLDSNRSRNPKLAKLMRAMNLCEERGMGIDIVEEKCEINYLPSPSINTGENFTRVTIFDHKTLRQFNSSDKVNLVYMHCCLQYIKHLPMTNESLRSRFAESVLSSTVASRWINEAVEHNYIKLFDPKSKSRKHARYIPIWA